MRPKMNLSALNTDFDTDAECRAALEDLRWPDGVRCLRCQSESISRISTRNQYDCDSCRYRFSVTTGTVFHDSHLPLPKWFLATLLMCEAIDNESADLPQEGESCTWVFYRFATSKGYVTVRWLGVSNGYHSERAKMSYDGERVR